MSVWISLAEKALPTYGLAAFATVDDAGRAMTVDVAGRSIVAVADCELALVKVGADMFVPEPGGEDFSAGCTFERSVPATTCDSARGAGDIAGRSSTDNGGFPRQLLCASAENALELASGADEASAGSPGNPDPRGAGSPASAAARA